MFSNTFPTILKIFFPNFSRAELIPKAISLRYTSIVDFGFCGMFLVKYEIYFFIRGNVIKGYIANESIFTIVTYFSFQFKYSHLSFTCDN